MASALAQHSAIPEHAGIIEVWDEERGHGPYARVVRMCQRLRRPKSRKDAVPLTEIQVNKLLHLGCMRIWGLKEHRWRKPA